ncbi:MAG: DUF2249 domain-containing protein [Trueperaceae bacterium]
MRAIDANEDESVTDDGAAPQGAAQTLDNRGLEPPMPMVRTLEAFERLPSGGTLTIRNDRVPVHLLPQLDARGARYQVEELADGGARVVIHKGPGPEAAR